MPRLLTRCFQLSTVVLIGAASAACSNTAPTPPDAVIVARVPASVPARVCTRCGDLVGEWEVAVDLVIEETAGGSGSVMAVTHTLLDRDNVVIEGPGVLTPQSLLQIGLPSTRISARGSMTIPQLGIHFPPAMLARLPGTYRLTVQFRDDNGNTSTVEVSVVVTVPG